MLARCKAQCARWLSSLLGRLEGTLARGFASLRAGLVPDQPEVGTRPAADPAHRKVTRRRIESGKVTECRHCGSRHPMYANGTICFMAFFYIWERDLLRLAKQEQGWRKLANALGFKDVKIDAPWTHPDEGRLVPYQRMKDGQFLVK